MAIRYSRVIAPARFTSTKRLYRLVMISSVEPIPAGVGITAAVMTDRDVTAREVSREISPVPKRIRNGIQYQKHSFPLPHLLLS